MSKILEFPIQAYIMIPYLIINLGNMLTGFELEGIGHWRCGCKQRACSASSANKRQSADFFEEHDPDFHESTRGVDCNGYRDWEGIVCQKKANGWGMLYMGSFKFHLKMLLWDIYKPYNRSQIGERKIWCFVTIIIHNQARREEFLTQTKMTDSDSDYDSDSDGYGTPEEESSSHERLRQRSRSRIDGSHNNMNSRLASNLTV